MAAPLIAKRTTSLSGELSVRLHQSAMYLEGQALSTGPEFAHQLSAIFVDPD